MLTAFNITLLYQINVETGFGHGLVSACRISSLVRPQSTRCSATVNGVTNVTSIAKAFNFGANYAASRQLGDVDSYARYNLRFRFDKNRGEFSVWLNDQIIGTAALDSMTSFGNCTFQLIHEGYADGAEKPLYIRQIGVRLEC